MIESLHKDPRLNFGIMELTYIVKSLLRLSLLNVYSFVRETDFPVKKVPMVLFFIKDLWKRQRIRKVVSFIYW